MSAHRPPGHRHCRRPYRRLTSHGRRTARCPASPRSATRSARGSATPRREQVRGVRQRLDEPLRVAIAGRLKAGKSTLVNALIGRRVAPTEVGECTRVVTQFRYGTADRVDVVRRDGSRVSLPLDEAGMIPQRLGVPAAEVAYVDVTLTSDQPARPDRGRHARAGLDQHVVSAPAPAGSCSTTHGARSTTTSTTTPPGRSPAPRPSSYVFTQSVRDDDVRALEAFRSVSARLASNPINSLGPVQQGRQARRRRRATRGRSPVRSPPTRRRVLRRVVSDVVPVVGLLAETTEAGRLTAADCEALRALSAAAAGRTAAAARLGRPVHQPRPCPVPREQRERLLRAARPVRHRLRPRAARRPPARWAAATWSGCCCQASGFPRLRQTLDQAFRWRTDAIKAGWALSTLEKTAGHADRARDRELLRDAIERVLQRPEYHRLRLLEVAAAGQHRRGRAARADGAGADPAGAVPGPAVDPRPARRRRRRAAPRPPWPPPPGGGSTRSPAPARPSPGSRWSCTAASTCCPKRVRGRTVRLDELGRRRGATLLLRSRRCDARWRSCAGSTRTPPPTSRRSAAARSPGRRSWSSVRPSGARARWSTR